MATKNATILARVEPEVKEQAEEQITAVIYSKRDQLQLTHSPNISHPKENPAYLPFYNRFLNL